MNVDKLKAKYHEKFRKNIDHNRDYFLQLSIRAWEARDNHPAMISDYTRLNGPTPQDRLELQAINELIKLYQTQINNKKERSVC